MILAFKNNLFNLYPDRDTNRICHLVYSLANSIQLTMDFII